MENERNLMTTTEAAWYLGLKSKYLHKMMWKIMRYTTKFLVVSIPLTVYVCHKLRQ